MLLVLVNGIIIIVVLSIIHKLLNLFKTFVLVIWPIISNIILRLQYKTFFILFK
jgi:hypothetical protein